MKYQIRVDNHNIVEYTANRRMTLPERMELVMKFVRERGLWSSAGVTIAEVA